MSETRGHGTVWIAKSKIPPFIQLLAAIKEEIGTDAKVAKFIGITKSPLYNLTIGLGLTAATAKAILKAYNKLQARGKV